MDFFGRKRVPSVLHPRKEPRSSGPLALERLEQIFQDCVDFTKCPVSLGKGGAYAPTLCYLSGMVKMKRVSDYVFRPLAQSEALARCETPQQAMEEMMGGALYSLSVAERTTLGEAVFNLMAGWCLLFFPGKSAVLSLFVDTREKRSISSPSNKTMLRGSRDAFVESLRTNASIARHHLKTPELRIREQVVGRQSAISVDILYIGGLIGPHLVEQVTTQLADIDTDVVLATGSIEEYVALAVRTASPLVQYTERSDRFCAGLAEGRVGILIDGLPLGYLAPSVLEDFLQAPQDKSESRPLASALALLHYLCMLGALLLSILHVATVTFHQEMIPTRLVLSITAAKQDVPFHSVFGAIVLLLASEILQGAGPRLPQFTGQTVSIIDGLAVGNVAVETKITSPAVLIMAAITGVAGYAMLSQEAAGTLYIWRLLLALLTGAASLLGVVAGLSAPVTHPAGIESLGMPYLTLFTSNARERAERHAVFCQPLPRVKQHPAALKTRDWRNQK